MTSPRNPRRLVRVLLGGLVALLWFADSAAAQGGPDSLAFAALPLQGTLVPGVPQSATLVESDAQVGGKFVHAWRLVLGAGDAVQVDMVSDMLDTYLYLMGSGSWELDDDDGDGTNSQLVFTAPATGEYRVVATTFSPGQSGTYTLTVGDPGFGGAPIEDAPVQSAPADSSELSALPVRGTLVRDLPQTATLVESDVRVAGKFAHAWRLNLEAGDVVQIDLGSDSVDMYLHLVGPGVWERDDDGGEARDSRLVFLAPQTGEYRVVATTFGEGRAGSYTLSAGDPRFGDVPIEDVVLGVGGSYTGALAETDASYEDKPSRAFPLTVLQGDSIVVDLIASFDALLQVRGAGVGERDDDGGRDTDSRVAFVAPMDATLTLLATSFGGATGCFRIVVTRTLATDPGTMLDDQCTGAMSGVQDNALREVPTEAVLSPGVSASARLAGGHPLPDERLARAWSFRPSGDQIATFRMTSLDFEPLLFVLGPGIFLAGTGGADEDTAVSVPLLGDSLYTVVATTRQRDEQGSFEVGVELLPEVELRTGQPDEAVLTLGEEEVGPLFEVAEQYGGRQALAWTIRPDPGDSLVIAVESDFDAGLTLFGPGLEPVVASQGEPRIVVERAADTDYRLVLSAEYGAMGCYALAVSSSLGESPDFLDEDRCLVDMFYLIEAGTVVPGEPLEGRADRRMDLDGEILYVAQFEFEASADDVVLRTVDRDDVESVIIGPAGFLEEDEVVVIPSDGTYRWLVVSEEAPASFAGRVDRLADLVPQWPEPIVLPDGDAWDLRTNAQLPPRPGAEAQPFHVWSLRGDAGTAVDVSVEGAGYGYFMLVVGPGVFEKAPSYPPDVQFSIQETAEEYRVVVGGPGQGCYSLRLFARGLATEEGPDVPSGEACSSRVVSARAPDLRDPGALKRGGNPGRLLDGEDVWVLEMDGPPRERSLTLTVHSEEFDPRIRVMNESLGPFNTLMDDDSGARCSDARLVLRTPGRYWVLVDDAGSTSLDGTYHLDVAEDPAEEPPRSCEEFFRALDTSTTGAYMPRLVLRKSATAGRQAEIAQPLNLPSELLPGEPQVVRLGLRDVADDLNDSTRVIVDVTSSAFDAYLHIVDPVPGQPTLYDDDGGSGCNARVLLSREDVEPRSDTVLVIVESFRSTGRGPYVLTASAGVAPPVSDGLCADLPAGFSGLDSLRTDGRDLVVGAEARVDALDSASTLLRSNEGYAEAWVLDLDEEDLVTVDLRSTEFDAFLYLSGPGLPALFDDDGGGGCNARLTVKAPKRGRYRVVVSSVHPRETGRYTLQASRSAPPVAPGGCTSAGAGSGAP